MADSAAQHRRQAGQKKSPKRSEKIQIKSNETRVCRKASNRDRANRPDLNDMWTANMRKQGQVAGQTSQQHSQALHFTHTNKTDRRTGSSNGGPCRTVVSCGTQCWLRQACLVTQSASLTLHTWLCSSTLSGFIQTTITLHETLFNYLMSQRKGTWYSGDWFLPPEMCPEDTVLPWMPPPRYNTPPVLHSVQEKLRLLNSRNQGYKGLRVRCCWILNNRTWQREKGIFTQRTAGSIQHSPHKWIEWHGMIHIQRWIWVALPWWTADALLRSAEAGAVAKCAGGTGEGRGRSWRTVTSCRAQASCGPVCRSLNIRTGDACKEKSVDIL